MKAQKVKATIAHRKTPADCGYNHVFQHEMPLGTYGVNSEWVAWCASNCVARWGWYFEATDKDYDIPEGFYPVHFRNQEAIMTFEDPKDLTYFALAFHN